MQHVQVAVARQLSLEWQAYVVRSHALRKVFVSVKGFYFQASSSFAATQIQAVSPLDAHCHRSLAKASLYPPWCRLTHRSRRQSPAHRRRR